MWKYAAVGKHWQVGALAFRLLEPRLRRRALRLQGGVRGDVRGDGGVALGDRRLGGLPALRLSVSLFVSLCLCLCVCVCVCLRVSVCLCVCVFSAAPAYILYIYILPNPPPFCIITI